MLDAFIIEELRRRERQRDKQGEDNRLQLPVDDAPAPRRPRSDETPRHDPSERDNGGYADSYEMPPNASGELVVIDT